MTVSTPQHSSDTSGSMMRATAGIILIGNELLSGQTADKNMNYIAKKLFSHGIDLVEVVVVADVQAEIIRVVRDYSKRFTYVFTTGGIGPTHDDITAETMALAFKQKYTQHQEAFEILKEKYGVKNLTDSRGRMAMMPEKARLIYNDETAAPGFIVENVYVMAGIPYIMQTMFDHALTMIPKGKTRLKVIIGCKVYESKLAPGLHEIQDAFPHVEIGSYPHRIKDEYWGVRIAITASDQDAFDNVCNQVLSLCQSFDDDAHVLDNEA